MKQIDAKTRRFYRVRLFISSTRLTPHVILMLSADKSGLLKADLARWAEVFGFEKPRKLIDLIAIFIIFMTFTPEFRNLFYCRLGVKAKLFSWMCLPLKDLDINAKYIGPGFFIQHGNGSLISAEWIGANCWINQQVTIGYTNAKDRPTIGNNVKIAPGARIIGKVKIGDNVVICPNTVVLDDVSPGVTVLGVPGRVIWKENVN
jgi:serine O-acetyltransferase